MSVSSSLIETFTRTSWNVSTEMKISFSRYLTWNGWIQALAGKCS